MMYKTNFRWQRESGFVLFVVLIAALLISFLVLAVMTQSAQDAKIAQSDTQQLTVSVHADMPLQRLHALMLSEDFTPEMFYRTWLGDLLQLSQANAAGARFCYTDTSSWQQRSAYLINIDNETERSQTTAQPCPVQLHRLNTQIFAYLVPIQQTHYLFDALPSELRAYRLLLYSLALKPVTQAQITHANSCLALGMYNQTALRCLYEQNITAQAMTMEILVGVSQSQNESPNENTVLISHPHFNHQAAQPLTIQRLQPIAWYDVRLVRD